MRGSAECDHGAGKPAHCVIEAQSIKAPVLREIGEEQGIARGLRFRALRRDASRATSLSMRERRVDNARKRSLARAYSRTPIRGNY